MDRCQGPFCPAYPTTDAPFSEYAGKAAHAIGSAAPAQPRPFGVSLLNTLKLPPSKDLWRLIFESIGDHPV
jgi:hypothetical protein